MANRIVITITVVTGTIAIILLSPAALVLIDALWSADWRRLADIGQAYGVASAIFSALAVVGVSASLIYQARTHRLTQVQAIRGTQRDLLLRVMENPKVYGQALGFRSHQDDGFPLEQYLMVTTWVGYLYSAFDSGAAAKEDLQKDPLAALFSGTIGRRWWEQGRYAWVESKDSKERRFAAIVDDAYMSALAFEPRDTDSYRSEQEGVFKSDRTKLVVSAAVLGAVIGVFAMRCKR